MKPEDNTPGIWQMRLPSDYYAREIGRFVLAVVQMNLGAN